MEYHAVKVGWIYQVHTNRLIPDGLIVWQDKIIEYIGTYDASEIPRGATVYDYPKSILMPPFVNAHTHIPETLIRGIVDDQPLETWLYDHVWQVEPQMNADDAKIGTRLGIAEMISSGTIAFIDQFYYSDEICQVVEETGVKAYLFPSIFDNNPENGAIENAFNVAQQTYDRWHQTDDRIKVGYGPHALYSVDHELFTKIGEKAIEGNTLIHTHVLETKTERKNAIDTWGQSTIMEFEDLGILDRILAAHVVHVDDQDIKKLEEYDTSVLHNIQSNMKLGSGLAPVPKFLEHGINVLVGTDGSASNNNLDMLEEIRTVSLIHKGINQDPKVLPSNDIFKMATTNAEKVFGSVYTGRLEIGQNCDFTIFNLNELNGLPIIKPLSNLLYSIQSSSCMMTVSNGNILYMNGEFLTLDIDQIKIDIQRSTDRMIEDGEYSG